MNILVVGSGGREHALVWKIMQRNPRYSNYHLLHSKTPKEQALCECFVVVIKLFKDTARFPVLFHATNFFPVAKFAG